MILLVCWNAQQKKGVDNISNVELISILSKQWANANDIQKIASCGRDNAILIRNKISKQILDSGKNLPTSRKKIVPMKSVIDYLNLNIDYICLMAEKELKIKY